MSKADYTLWGGECYTNECKYHSKDEPFCNAINLSNEEKVVFKDIAICEIKNKLKETKNAN